MRSNIGFKTLVKYRDTVFKSGIDVRQVEENANRLGIEHAIELNDKTPVTTKQFRLSPQQRQEVLDWTKQMLNDGVIKRSTSPYNSPIFCVKKPIGWRIVHDYRLLNGKTLCPVEPIPYRQDIVDSMSGSFWFSKKEHRQYTAFSTPDGHFEYIVTLMGLSDAQATFNRSIQHVFRDLQDYSRVFFDDIYVFTKDHDVEKHLIALDRVLQRCQEQKLYIKIEKCIIAQAEIPVLGS